MTPLTAEKIAELERLLAAATPRPWHRHSECPAECCWHLFEGPDMMYGRPDERGDADGINSPELSDEDSALIVAAINALPSLLSLAKRVAGAPVGPDLGAAIAVVDRAQHGLIRWSEGKAFGDHVADCYLLGDLQALIRGLEKQRIALVEIVGGEEGNG